MDSKKQIPGFILADQENYRRESALDLRQPQWMPCEFRFRGEQPEIQKLQGYLTQNKIHITHQEAVSEEIGEIRVIAEKETADLIEKFPALKATGLVENWDRYCDRGIYVAYSESGFSVITDYAYAGAFEGHHEGGDGRWEWEYDMMEDVCVSFTWLQSGEQEYVNYSYPYRSRWKRRDYVREVDGDLYISVVAEEFKIVDGILRRYLGAGGEVVIPETVSCVGERAFEGCRNLTKVVLAEGVTEIEERAFAYCTALTQVRLPDSLREIGSGAFEGCSSLDVAKLYLPACEKFDVFNPFSGCKNIPDVLYSSDQTKLFYSNLMVEQVVVSDSVRKIHESAFSFRQKLTSVQLPQGLQEIGCRAFAGCSNLREITIPDTVEKIDPWAFCRCSALKEIRIPGSVKVIPDAMLSECTALETVIIEEGVTEIRAYAFEKCKKLKHVYLPSSIRKKIRGKLFEKNPNLVIHGVPGSPAEAYAKEKGFRFAPIEENGYCK